VIKKLSLLGTRNQEIKEAAEYCNKQPDRIKAVFDFAYDKIVYRPDGAECKACKWEGLISELLNKNSCPNCRSEKINSKQQLRTIENILRENEGNCTHYATIIGSLLILLDVPFFYRVVNLNRGSGLYEHIYIVTKSGIKLDPVIGQKQNGKETKESRPENGKYNKEVKYNYKLDYLMPQLEILQGTETVSSERKISGRSQAARLGKLSNNLGCCNCGGNGLGSIFCGKDCQARKNMKTQAKAAGFYGKNAQANVMLASQGVDHKSSTWDGITKVTGTVANAAQNILSMNKGLNFASGVSSGGGNFQAGTQPGSNTGKITEYLPFILLGGAALMLIKK
jgi:predicted Zn-ribbon and HTH transcriptional regulator